MSYSIIFTDFNMPVMNGIQATKEMRQYMDFDLQLDRDSQPNIIGVTGHVLEEYQNEGLEAGMDEIIAKPLYIGVLKNMLAKYQRIE